jgi:hypothetical protein
MTLSALALLSSANAPPNCISPPHPYRTASSRNRNPAQSYVLAALYELWGATRVGPTSGRNARAEITDVARQKDSR